MHEVRWSIHPTEYYTAVKMSESKKHIPTLEQSGHKTFLKFEATVTNFLTWKLCFGRQTVL